MGQRYTYTTKNNASWGATARARRFLRNTVYLEPLFMLFPERILFSSPPIQTVFSFHSCVHIKLFYEKFTESSSFSFFPLFLSISFSSHFLHHLEFSLYKTAVYCRLYNTAIVAVYCFTGMCIILHVLVLSSSSMCKFPEDQTSPLYSVPNLMLNVQLNIYCGVGSAVLIWLPQLLKA